MNTRDGGPVGVWGGISGRGMTKARIFEGTMNGTLYCDILQQKLTQSIGKLPNKSAYIFQQDLTPWHTSKLIQEKMAKLNLNALESPSNSSYLSSVEMLWSTLNKKLAAKPIYSIMELC